MNTSAKAQKIADLTDYIHSLAERIYAIQRRVNFNEAMLQSAKADKTSTEVVAVIKTALEIDTDLLNTFFALQKRSIAKLKNIDKSLNLEDDAQLAASLLADALQHRF